MEEITIDVCGIKVNAISRGSNFDIRISRETAIDLLSTYPNLPFEIMCKEYGPDEDWIGMTADDLEYGGRNKATLNDEYQTFEIWHENKTIADLPNFPATKDNSNYTISSKWSVQDILHQAKEDEVIVTVDEAKEILHWIDNKHDASIGINWDVISTYISMFLHEHGRGDYQYGNVEYNGVEYTCRLIKDPIDKTIIIAPESLLKELQNEYGRSLTGCSLDKTIAHYSTPEEIILPDKELYNLIYK